MANEWSARNLNLKSLLRNYVSRNTIAYVPMAHNVVPWWTEAYTRQEKGDFPLPKNDWFTARVDMIGDEFSLFIDDQFV